MSRVAIAHFSCFTFNGMRNPITTVDAALAALVVLTVFMCVHELHIPKTLLSDPERA